MTRKVLSARLGHVYLWALVLLPLSAGSLAIPLLGDPDDISAIGTSWEQDGSDMGELGSEGGARETTGCSGGWMKLRDLCWTLVPSQGGPQSSDQDPVGQDVAVVHAALYCSQLRARLLPLAGRFFCLKDIARPRQFRFIDDTLSTDITVKNKRIMGNVGF